MSGVLKSIGKIFRKAVRVIKKVALPVLAIAAVVLTGGAALGVLPALSTTLGSLGLSAGLTSVLSSAATSATIGAGMSLITGGDPIKGATSGLIAGAVFGGANLALSGAAKGLGAAAANTGSIAPSTLTTPTLTTASGVVPGQAISLGGEAATGLGQAAAAGVPAAAAPAASSGGGVMGFINRNPIVAGTMIQGLGSGITAREQAKEAQRRQRGITDSYNGTDGLWLDPQANAAGAAPGARQYADLTGGTFYYDPSLGRLVNTARG